MENFRKSKFLKHCLLITFLSVMMLTSFANTSFIGAGINANPQYPLNASEQSSLTAAPAALAVAAGAITLAWAAGYVVGTVAHHAWDLFLTDQDPELAFLKNANYKPEDFSKFDN